MGPFSASSSPLATKGRANARLHAASKSGHGVLKLCERCCSSRFVPGRYVVGFMYRRNAGSGTPDIVFGRISEGYLKLTVAGERMERVRRSSGGREGAVKLEKDFAAVLRARREAVRLDFRVDFGFVVGWERVGKALGFQGVGSVGEVGRSGCSSQLIASLGGEETVFSFRSEGDLRGGADGMQGSLMVERVL